jgi:hypothetical protein
MEGLDTSVFSDRKVLAMTRFDTDSAIIQQAQTSPHYFSAWSENGQHYQPESILHK